MKQKDIALIIVIVVVVAIFSFILSSLLIVPSEERQEQVEVVGQITSEFVEPDEDYFNDSSNNPTQIIRIGPGGNQNPFSSGPQ